MKLTNLKELYFGTPGIPISAKPHDTINGIKQVRKLGLDAMEIEFVRSIHVNKQKAPEVYETARANKVLLTTHGTYFVNLASLKKETISASIKRMVDDATRAHECGVRSITWHAAFFQGRPKEQVFKLVKQNLKEVLKKLHDKGIKDIWLRPETTGKESQWGDLQETIRLSQELEGVLPCVDFAHLHARYVGKNNTTSEFRKLLTDLEKGLGRKVLNDMHIHMSGINYGPKGERNHLILKESDFNYKDLIKVWKEFKIKGIVINESPNVEGDALLMQKTYHSLK